MYLDKLEKPTQLIHNFPVQHPPIQKPALLHQHTHRIQILGPLIDTGIVGERRNS